VEGDDDQKKQIIDAKTRCNSTLNESLAQRKELDELLADLEESDEVRQITDLKFRFYSAAVSIIPFSLLFRKIGLK
jgi:hypothetical protein